MSVDVGRDGADLYPTCPTSVGTGIINGDSMQVAKLLAVAGSQPTRKMKTFWNVHSHPARKGRKAYEG